MNGVQGQKYVIVPKNTRSEFNLVRLFPFLFKHNLQSWPLLLRDKIVHPAFASHAYIGLITES